MKLLKILRPTKALLFCIFFCYSFFALTTAVSAQASPDTAFYQLQDLTGYDSIPKHLADSINVAALSLRDALPEDYRSNFGVYDLGFYHHHSSLVGGIPDVITNAITNHVTHSYYLIFGRELDNEGNLKKVWVEMELPEGGYFSCINSSMPTVLNELLTKSRLNLYPTSSNGLNNTNYDKAFSHEISHFKDKLNYLKSCCPTSSCNPCVYSNLDVFKLLLERNFILDPIRIVNDPDFGSPPLALLPGSSQSRTANDLNVEIGFLEDDIELGADYYINSFLEDDSGWIYEMTGQSISHSVHVFKYPRDCNLFESKWNEYINDPSDHKVIFIIINIDNSFGVLGFHYEVATPAGGFSPHKSGYNRDMGFQGEYPYEDEIIGIQEILDSANATCQTVLISSLAVGAFEREKLDAYYRHSKPHREAIDHHLEIWTEGLREANYTLSIFLVRELEAVRKEMGYEDCKWWQLRFCSLRSRWQAEYNVCRQLIHTTLDICGMFFPVCDLANMTLYLNSGDLRNATFSAIGTMPIAGHAAVGIKYAAQSVKLGDKVAILKFSVERSGHVHWVGGRDKLRNVIKRLGIQHTFDGIQLTYNSAIHNAHHLIPWSLVDRATTKHMYLMQRLARLEWHPSNPYKNGLIIPKNLPNGNTFHGSHASYNRWVDDALSEINKVQDSQLISKMDELSNILKLEIEKAYQANRSIHRHFDDIILMPRYKDLIK